MLKQYNREYFMYLYFFYFEGEESLETAFLLFPQTSYAARKSRANQSFYTILMTQCFNIKYDNSHSKTSRIKCTIHLVRVKRK